MRLTLRTLLAYLDDLLSPSEAKEIGAKLQESPLAQELADRIRDVIRRRRLTAPVAIGPGTDVNANMVAEYLDNTLPADAVADLEGICLGSDMHLAEVASCHQILTLVLGEPVEILPTSRERMYALGNSATPLVPEPARPEAATTTPAAARAPIPEVAAAASKPPAVTKPGSSTTVPATADSFQSTIPAYLKPQPLWRRSLPYVAVLLLIGAWVGALYYDPSLMQMFQPNQPAAGTATAQAPATPAKPAKPKPAPAVAATDAPAQAGDREVAALDLPAEEMAEELQEMPAEPAPAVSLDLEPPPDAPEPPITETNSADVNPGAVVPESKESINPQPAPAEKPATKPAPEKPVAKPNEVAAVTPQAAPKPAVVASAVVGQYVSPEGIVLRFDADREAWYPLPHRAQLFGEDMLAVPEPFEAECLLGNERNRATVIGPSVVAFSNSQDGVSQLAVQRGRVIIQPAAPRSDAHLKLPYNIHISVGPHDWTLSLQTADTVCGLEVVPQIPQTFEEEPTGNQWVVKLAVVSGTVQLTGNDMPENVVTAPSQTILLGEPIDPASAATVPDWMIERKISTVVAANGRHLERAFEVDATAHDALATFVEDRRPEVARLAAEALTLTGDYDVLVRVLDRNEHGEARAAAIHGLRVWLLQAPEHRDLLKADLEANFYPAEVDLVYRLIWGYTRREAQEKELSLLLVNGLNHDRLAVRELCWDHIKRLTGRKVPMEYRPDGTLLVRRNAVQYWQKILEKEGSLVPPTKSTAVGNTVKFLLGS